MGVSEAYRDDAAARFAVFMRAMSHERKKMMRLEYNKVVRRQADAQPRQALAFSVCFGKPVGRV